MARNLHLFYVLLICASFVNVEPRYTEKSPKSVRETKPHHSSKPHHSEHHAHTPRSLSGGAGYPSGTQASKTHQAHSYPSSHGKSGNRPVTSPPYRPPVHESVATQHRHTGSHASPSHTLSAGAGYPSGTQAPKTHQAHSYPSSHGKSGNRPVTSPPYRPPVHESVTTQHKHTGSHALPNNTWSGGAGYPSGTQAPKTHVTSPPYRPPVHESVATQNKHAGSYATPNNTWFSGAGYPAGTQPPKTGQQTHTYPNPATSPPAAYPLYPQSSPKPHGHQYPGNLSGNSGSREAQKQASLSSTYPSGLSSNGLLMQPSVPGYQASTKPPAPSYPSANGGLSGSSNRSTPQSSSYLFGTGASGNVGTNTRNQYPNSQRNKTVTYPTNAGLSGGSSPTMQRLNASASYPSQNGLSGTGHIQQQGGAVYPLNGNKPPTTQTHSYPASNGQSGGGHKPPAVNYPQHGTYPHPQQTHANTGYNNHIYVKDHYTTVHHVNPQRTHIYHYRPPSHVYFVDNGMQNHYPVYREKLPTYVYEYRSSPSRFRTLLSGLALFNLGHLSKNSESHRYHNHYFPTPNEDCKFIVRYDSLHQDEVNVDCRLMTDFIYTVHSNAHNPPKVQTGMNQILLSNGALAQPQQLSLTAQNLPSPQNQQVVDALDPRFNGAPLQIQSGMKCYMKYSDGFFVNTDKYVSCGLLEKYDKMSFNSAIKLAPTIIMVITTIALAVLN